MRDITGLRRRYLARCRDELRAALSNVSHMVQFAFIGSSVKRNIVCTLSRIVDDNNLEAGSQGKVGHGKRSGGHNNAYLVPSKTVNEMQQGIPPLTKEQFILSRLIGRPLVSNKYKGRWDRLFKIKTSFPEHWDDAELNAHLINDESIRDQNNNEDMNQGKRKHTNDAQDLTGNINDERKEIQDILMISNNEDNQHGSKPQNVELFKFLDWWGIGRLWEGKYEEWKRNSYDGGYTLVAVRANPSFAIGLSVIRDM
ncbi:hypothetical protein WN48_08992 [Eufriesea mexicana]|uniref:Uncharacterized protein n=1 Tax=Eufriesea mexicana TaxID=516756 RepID=A0A310SRK6_9HYME|nr:hypothetical protein WN48_08992 [Eufriesea mexicana]